MDKKILILTPLETLRIATFLEQFYIDNHLHAVVCSSPNQSERFSTTLNQYSYVLLIGNTLNPDILSKLSPHLKTDVKFICLPITKIEYQTAKTIVLDKNNGTILRYPHLQESKVSIYETNIPYFFNENAFSTDTYFSTTPEINLDKNNQIECVGSSEENALRYFNQVNIELTYNAQNSLTLKPSFKTYKNLFHHFFAQTESDKDIALSIPLLIIEPEGDEYSTLNVRTFSNICSYLGRPIIHNESNDIGLTSSHIIRQLNSHQRNYEQWLRMRDAWTASVNHPNNHLKLITAVDALPLHLQPHIDIYRSEIHVSRYIFAGNPTYNGQLKSSYSYLLPKKVNKPIPKIIHQIWIGPNKPPYEWLDSWKRDYLNQHPEWEYKLWRDEDIEKLQLINQAEYNREPTWHGKSDIARYEILHRYGGIYIDADTLWLGQKSLDGLLEKASTEETSFVVANENDQQRDKDLCNGFIASSTSHPCLMLLIAFLKHNFALKRKSISPNIVTGPHLLTSLMSNNAPFSRISSNEFSPLYWVTEEAHKEPNPYKYAKTSIGFHMGYSTNNLGQKK